jgi:hypothetical protein
MDKIAIQQITLRVLVITLAFSLTVGIIVVVSPISMALLPRFTALYSGESGQNFKLFNKINLFVAVLVFHNVQYVFFCQELIWIWTGNVELAVQTSVYIPVLLGCNVIADNSFNIAIANGYTKLNNIVGVVSLFITLPGIGLPQKKLERSVQPGYIVVVQFLITLIYLYVINNKFLKVKGLASYMLAKCYLPDFPCCGFSGFHLFQIGQKQSVVSLIMDRNGLFF